jgi:hypothetical protein
MAMLLRDDWVDRAGSRGSTAGRRGTAPWVGLSIPKNIALLLLQTELDTPEHVATELKWSVTVESWKLDLEADADCPDEKSV